MKRRFSKLRRRKYDIDILQVYRYEPHHVVETTVRGKTWKRPICAACGKKIRDIKQVKIVDGRPYHVRCVEEGVRGV